MLKSISWYDFISTITFLVGGYYMITALLLYSREVRSMFTQRKPVKANLAENKRPSDEPGELMGAVRSDLDHTEHIGREVKVETESLQVVAAEEQEEAVTLVGTNDAEETIRRSVGTLLEEINTLKEIVAVGTREECAELFRTLLSNYPDLAASAHEPEITAYIHNVCSEHGQFQIEQNEVNSWWPQAEETKSINKQ